MMLPTVPPLALTIISFLQLALKAAPEAKHLYDEARAVITRLFKGGLITKAQQKELMGWANAHEAATLAGDVPPELQVEP